MHTSQPALEDILIAQARLDEAEHTAAVLREQLAVVADESARRIEALTTERDTLLRHFAELYTAARRHEYVAKAPDDITHVVVRLLETLVDADAVEAARKEGAEQQREDDADKIEAAEKARSELAGALEEADAMRVSLERQLEFAERQLELLAEDAPAAERVLRARLQAELDDVRRANAELVDDLATVAKRCETTLAAEPPKRNPAAPLRAALTLMQGFAAQAAEVHAHRPPDRLFHRAAEVTAVVDDDGGPFDLCARVVVFARDEDETPRAVGVDLAAWGRFESAVEQALEALAGEPPALGGCASAPPGPPKAGTERPALACDGA